jgi:hypothetical protein
MRNFGWGFLEKARPAGNTAVGSAGQVLRIKTLFHFFFRIGFEKFGEIEIGINYKPKTFYSNYTSYQQGNIMRYGNLVLP